MSLIYQPNPDKVEGDIIATLETYLKAQFAAAPYAATFARWGGVGITRDDRYAEKYFNAKKPFVYLSILDGEHTRDWRNVKVDGAFRRAVMHIMTVTAEIITGDFSGNRVGASNPTSSTQLMRDALQDILSLAAPPMAALGLYQVTVKPNQQKAMNPLLINPHDVPLIAYTLKPVPSTP